MPMHVVSVPPEPFRVADGRIEVHCVPAATDNLVWIAVCTETGDAAVVDGPGASELLAYTDPRGIRITAIWNTHTHGDHIGVNRELLAMNRLPPQVVGPALVRDQVPGLTVAVDEGDTVALGAVTARVMRTEGHIRGHVSFVLPGVVFCGDTMFAGGCGRIFDGTPEQLFSSLLRLAELPGDTLVCCAHEYTQDNLRFAWFVEPDNAALADRIRQVWALRSEGRCVVPSTLGLEQATNPFLRPGSPTIVGAVPPADRGTPLSVFAALRRLKDQGVHKPLPEPLSPGGV